MTKFLFRQILLMLVFLNIILLLASCTPPTETKVTTPPESTTIIPTSTVFTPTSTPEPSKTPLTPSQPRTLTICLGAEPESLDFYHESMLAQSNILEAIYDGPIDTVGFSFQPVILEKLRTLDDATIQPVAVKENDYVVNDVGDTVLLKPGEVVRPYGCNLSACAITWQGEPLEMSQMSATFKLKDGLRWSDGEPLTADDSLFGYEIAMKCRSRWDSTVKCGSLGAGDRYTLARTSSYIALDENTTQWLGLPGFIDQTYMTNFAHPLPRHQAQNYTPQQFQDILTYKPLGWGPYQIDKWQYGEYIRLSRNPYYFRADEGLPYFDQLIFRFFGKDEQATLSALQDGECDLVDYEQAGKNLNLERLIEEDQNGHIQALFAPGTQWEHLDFNIQPSESIINNGAFAGWDLDGDGKGPFGDVRLRQAIAMCLDRQALVDVLFMGQSIMPDTYILPEHPLFNPQVVHWSYDPDAAAALLDEIGWTDADNDPSTPRNAVGVTGVPDGTPLVMNYETTTAVEIRRQVFDLLSNNLAGCGIQVNLVTYSTNDFFKPDATGRVFARLYDIVEFTWLTGITPPCRLFMGSSIPTLENNWSGQNNSGFSDIAYDEACTFQQEYLFGNPGYARSVHEAQRIFAEQLPVVPLYFNVKYAAARLDMCGYSVDPSSSSDFWNIESFNYGEGCK